MCGNGDLGFGAILLAKWQLITTQLRGHVLFTAASLANFWFEMHCRTTHEPFCTISSMCRTRSRYCKRATLIRLLAQYGSRACLNLKSRTLWLRDITKKRQVEMHLTLFKLISLLSSSDQGPRSPLHRYSRIG